MLAFCGRPLRVLLVLFQVSSDNKKKSINIVLKLMRNSVTFIMFLLKIVALYSLTLVQTFNAQYLEPRAGGFPGIFFPQNSLFSPKVNRNEFSALNTRVEDVEKDIARLATRISGLQERVNNIKPKCPSDAVGAVVIGNLCFSIEVLPQNYDGAKSRCFQKGGRLAEPVTSDEQFYNRLATALPVASNSVSGSLLYVGIAGDASDFKYESNGVSIDTGDGRWSVTPATPAADEAAAVQRVGSSWRLVEQSNRATTTLPFVCQYETVL